MKLIGPVVVQLPQNDRATVCRSLLQFMEAEESKLIRDQIDAAAATAQAYANISMPSQPPSTSHRNTLNVFDGSHITAAPAGFCVMTESISQHEARAFPPPSFSHEFNFSCEPPC